MRSKLIGIAAAFLAIGGDSTGSYTSSVPATTNQNAAMQLANAISNQNGIIDLRASVGFIELFEKPNTTLLTAKGRNAADNADAAITAYAWNTDAFNKSEIISSGLEGLAVEFNDGFQGKNINRHIQFDNSGRGVPFNQLTVTAKDSSGNQDLTLIENMQLTMLTYTVIAGREKPVVIDLASALRNTQQQSGLVTILLEGFVNSQTQWSWVVDSACTISINVQWGIARS